MRNTARFIVGGVLVCAALASSGCSTFYSGKMEGVPENAPEITPRPGSVDFDPFVMWDEEGEQLQVVTWGSTSCPNAPRALAVVGHDEFILELVREGGPFCTADIGPTTFDIPAPDGITPRDVLIIDIGPGLLVQKLGPTS